MKETLDIWAINLIFKIISLIVNIYIYNNNNSYYIVTIYKNLKLFQDSNFFEQIKNSISAKKSSRVFQV